MPGWYTLPGVLLKGAKGDKGDKGDRGDTGPGSWAGGVYAAGNVTGAWAPAPTNGPDQDAAMTGDVTLAAPAAGANGQKMLVTLRASGASRVLSLGSLARLAGLPPSRQVAVGQQAWALLRYSTALTRWTVIAFAQEG